MAKKLGCFDYFAKHARYVGGWYIIKYHGVELGSADTKDLYEQLKEHWGSPAQSIKLDNAE